MSILSDKNDLTVSKSFLEAITKVMTEDTEGDKKPAEKVQARAEKENLAKTIHRIEDKIRLAQEIQDIAEPNDDPCLPQQELVGERTEYGRVADKLKRARDLERKNKEKRRKE